MHRIAIVEDTPADRDHLIHFIKRYQVEHDISFALTTFDDGITLMDEADLSFDLIIIGY